MIDCKLHHLEARCRERGYTLDEVRPCIVSQDGESITVDETHEAYPLKIKAGHAMPSLLTRAKNFATSAARHVATGMKTATQEQIDARYAICEACEFFSAGACSECGCPLVRQMKTVSKLAWANESCPVGKWGPVEPAT